MHSRQRFLKRGWGLRFAALAIGFLTLPISHQTQAQNPEPNKASLVIHSGQPRGIISRNIYGQFAEHLGRLTYEGLWVGEMYAAVEKPNQLGGGAAPAADQPTPRLDQNSQLAHAQLLEKARKGRIDIYFEGDSITRRWGTSDAQYKDFLANWRQNFFGWNAADFGWGGDTTQNILWRLNNGELDNVNPKIIVVMAGTNNIGNRSPEGSEDPRVADITRGIKAIVDVCRQKAPKATIVLMGITPRNDNLAVMPIINKINANLAKFADGKRVRYLNINDRLADKEGRLFEGMSRDGLHLDVKGYQVWADALKPIFTKLLGPPAKEDHAPPPTGDPSAVKRPSG
jgi:lysophospholipase L1-like esterase